MVKKFFLGLLLVLISPAAFAQWAQVKLKCAAASGQTKLEAVIPGDSDESRVSVTLNALSVKPTVIHFLNRAMVEIEQVNGKETYEIYPLYRESIIASITPDGIKTLMISVLDINDYNLPALNLVAKPETIQLKHAGSSTKGTFEAVLSGPRNPQKEGFPAPTRLNCSYNYST